ENVLVSGSRDKTVILWDTRTWKVRRVIPVLERVECTGFLGNGSFIYTGGESGKVRIWETENGKEATQEQEVGGDGENVVHIIHHSDLPFLLSIHADQTLLLHSLSPLGDLSSGGILEPLPMIRRISGFHDEIIDLAYLTPDHLLLALATNTEDVRLVSLMTSANHPSDDVSRSPVLDAPYFGADVALLKGHEDIIICLDVDWSGCWLATGAKDNTARLWRIDPTASSYTCFATFTGHAESLGAISMPRMIPPVGSAAYMKPLDYPPPFLLTGSQDRTIKRWDTTIIRASAKADKKPARAVYTRKAHDKDINAIDVNHNSTLFATASQDRTVKIWSVEEGEVQGVLRGHRRGVWSVKFAPRDSPTFIGDNGPASASRGIVLTGSGDKTAKLWSLADYSCLRTLEGHTNSILKVVWLNPVGGEGRDKRGALVATAGGDGLVKVWDANSAEVECTLDNHEDRVWALAVHPTTNTLVSGGGDGTITFWADTTSTTIAASAAASTARVEQEQQLQNYIHAHSYRSAITLALQLNHPGRLLALFTSVVNTNPPESGSLSGLVAVDEVLASLGEEQFFTLLLRIRDWNTNARTAPVAQRILWTLVKCYPASSFTRLRSTSRGADVRGSSLKEVINALKAYTERHYRRMEDLVNESYLIEYTLREMDEVAFANGDGTSDRDQDFIMV
ncbi:MAG: U3 small nucleolar RNA-associated protein 13, partial [Pleopsidium flavum]